MRKQFVIEYHYKDGDVGSYLMSDKPVSPHELYEGFAKGHKPSHIIIRPAMKEEFHVDRQVARPV